MSLSTEQALQKAKRHAQNGEAQLAAQLYKAVLGKFPNNKRAMDGLKSLQTPRVAQRPHLTAVPQTKIQGLIALMGQGRFKEAQSELAPLVNQFPKDPLLLNMMGAVSAGLDQHEQAISWYKRALKISPNYPEAHKNMGVSLVALDREEEAVGSLMAAIKIKPNYAEAYNVLGTTLLSLKKYEEAIISLTQVLKFHPNLVEALVNLGSAYRGADRYDEAIATFEKAIKINPNNAKAHNNLGLSLQMSDQYERALESYKKSIELNPKYFEAHRNMAVAQNHAGRREEAIKNYTRALELKPDYAVVHRGLSGLKKYEKGDLQFVQIENLLKKDDLPDTDRMHLSFALAKAYGDIKDIDRSFKHLSVGNRLRKKADQYDISEDAKQIADIRSAFSNQMPSTGGLTVSRKDREKQPVFIVGMPRSGTTLTEQILASHSRVFGAGELSTIRGSLRKFDWQSVGPDPEKMQQVREEYLTDIAERAGSEDYVTDKMPLNFRWVGFILAAMPEAKIIHTRRDPRATCWSIYKHYFASSGNKYGYDLRDVAEYYNMHLDLMAFWHEKFPGQIYEMNYEALTENQEEETRKLIAHVGLDWEDQCLSFHKTERAVRTASASQVRQKMYKGSSEEWRKYEKHLGPMIEILEGYEA